MNSGNRMRLKTGEVVTVVTKTPGNLLCKTAEGDVRYVSVEQVCHILGNSCQVCDKKEENSEE